MLSPQAVVTRVGRQPYLFCANAGDCRAVLYTQLANGTRRCACAQRGMSGLDNVQRAC